MFQIILDIELKVIGQNFTLSKKDLMFGYNLQLQHPYNFLILHLKYYIYGRRCANKELIPREFLYKLKHSMEVERYLSKKIRDNISHTQSCSLY